MDSSHNKKKESQSQLPNHMHSFNVGETLFVVNERYEYMKQISLGSFGVVCSCFDKKESKNVAIKKIANAFNDLSKARKILREIKLLRFIEHDHLITLLDIPLPENKADYDDIYIITDLMETDLHRVIYSKQELTDDHIQYFIYQILKGILYMHSANLVHRDLKPSNILANKNCDLKICDFGLGRRDLKEAEDEMTSNTGKKDDKAKKIEENDELTEYVIAKWYRAPEVLLCPTDYSKAVDIWSIGCIFAELLGRQPLFPGDHFLEQMQKIISVLGTPSTEDLEFLTKQEPKDYLKKLAKRTKQQFSSLFPDANPVALDLLDKMLIFNPKKRFTAEQCLSHPYFEGLHDPELEPIASSLFDWSFDDKELAKEQLQKMIYEESKHFHSKDNDK